MKVLAGLVVLAALTIPLAFVSCEPIGQVGVDTTGDGVADVQAYDLNFDKKPDVDAEGNVKFIWGSGTEPAKSIDTVVPKVLTATSAIAGLGFLGTLALLWKKYPLIKGAKNLITTLQVIREKAAADGLGAGVEMIDKILKAKLTTSTKKVVSDIKTTEGLYL